MDEIAADLRRHADEIARLVDRRRAEIEPSREPVEINLGPVDEWLFEEGEDE